METISVSPVETTATVNASSDNEAFTRLHSSKENLSEVTADPLLLGYLEGYQSYEVSVSDGFVNCCGQGPYFRADYRMKGQSPPSRPSPTIPSLRLEATFTHSAIALTMTTCLNLPSSSMRVPTKVFSGSFLHQKVPTLKNQRSRSAYPLWRIKIT